MNRCKLLLLALAAASVTHPIHAQTWETVDTSLGLSPLDIIAGPGTEVFTFGQNIGPDGTDTRTSSVRRSLDSGATWTTVASLPCDAGKLSMDSAGQLYAAGVSSGQAVVFRSSDAGATWTPIFANSSPHGQVRPTAPVFDGSGNIYITLRSPELVQTSRRTTAVLDVWLVWKGVPEAGTGGYSWSQVDRYRLDPTRVSLVYDAVVRPSTTPGEPDEIFVGGGASSTSGTFWIVRKSSDGGATWNTINSYQLSSKTGDNWIRSMAVDSEGVLYAVGEVDKALSKTTIEKGWLARKSSDGGVSWSNLDYVARGRGPAVAVDRFGRLFVAGYQVVQTQSGSFTQWIVRGSSDAGQTWFTTDQLPFNTIGRSVVGDDFGNVFVCGSANDPTLGRIGSVRKLATP